jgi:hypothetical protein
MRRALACCLCLVGLTAWAQAVPAPLAAEAASEAERIESTRTTQAAALDAEEAACYQRFAVSGCLNDVRSKRRAMQAALRRQEAALHEREFAERAAEQRARNQKKREEREQSEQELRRGNGDSDRAEKLQAQQDKLTRHLAPRQQPQASNPVAPQATGPTPAEQAANRASFARKQAEADKKRQEIAQRATGKASAPRPLPVPP